MTYYTCACGYKVKQANKMLMHLQDEQEKHYLQERSSKP